MPMLELCLLAMLDPEYRDRSSTLKDFKNPSHPRVSPKPATITIPRLAHVNRHNTKNVATNKVTWQWDILGLVRRRGEACRPLISRAL